MSLFAMIMQFFGMSFGRFLNKEGIPEPQIDVCASGSCVESWNR